MYAQKKAAYDKYGNDEYSDHWKFLEELKRMEAEFNADKLRAAEEEADEEKKTLQNKWQNISNLENLGVLAAEDAYKKRKELIAEYCPEYSDEWYSYYKEVYDYEKENAEDIEEILRDKWQNISNLENLGVLSAEEAYQKRKELIAEYCPEYSEEWYSYYKEVYDYEHEFSEKQLADRKEALNEELNAVKTNIGSIISEYKTAYSEIQNNISSYKSKLLSVAGNVFEVEETENPDGTKTRSLKVNDIREQIAKMREYHAALLNLRDKGADASLLREMSELSPEDGIQLTDYMISSGDFDEINALYKERDEIAEQLAEDFYSPDIERLNSSTADRIINEYSVLPEEFRSLGEQAALELILGLSEGISDISAELEVNTEDFFGRFEHAIDNVSRDSVTVNADVNSGDSFEKGRADGELYAEGFTQGAYGISAEVEVNSRQNASMTSLSENMMTAIAQKIIDGIKNIQIKNTINAELNLDGKKVTSVVNENNSTLGRTAGI